MEAICKLEVDRLAELANVGAGHAATALASLVARTIWIGVPEIIEGDAGIRIAPDAEAVGCRGIFFEFDGCLDAVIGILFPEAASDYLVRTLVGNEEAEIDATTIESVLMEVGNILASHMASAIADTLGSRLLPSVPTFVMQRADRAFESRVEAAIGPNPLRIVTRLHDATRSLEARLIVVPTGDSTLSPFPTGSSNSHV